MLSIMRLSSGSRTVMGGDAAGQSIGNNLMARAKSLCSCKKR